MQVDVANVLDGLSRLVDEVCSPQEARIIRLFADWDLAPGDRADPKASLYQVLGISEQNRKKAAVDAAIAKIVKTIQAKAKTQIAQLRRGFDAESGDEESLAVSIFREVEHRGESLYHLPNLILHILSAPGSKSWERFGYGWYRDFKKSEKSSLLTTDEGRREWAKRLYQACLPPLTWSVISPSNPLLNGGTRIPKADSLGTVRRTYSEKMKKDIWSESDDEWDFLNMLETSSIVQGYSSQPVAIDWRDPRNGSSFHLHHPDIFVLLEDGRGLLIEVKDLEHMAYGSVLRKALAAKEFAHRKGIGYIMCDFNLRTVANLLSQKYPEDLRADFLATVDADGFPSWEAIKPFEKRHKIRSVDVSSLVAQYDLDYERKTTEERRFHLRRSTDGASFKGLV